jgi:DNA-dependent RNA polymerase
MATAELTFSQQRELERKQKREAEEKMAKSLHTSFKSGEFSTTQVASRIIKKEHILSTSQWIGKHIKANLLWPTNVLSETVKQSLACLAVAEESDANSFPLAANAAAVTLKAILDVSVSQSGDVVSDYLGYSIYSSQGTGYAIQEIGSAVEHELKLNAFLLVNKPVFYGLKKIANNPAYSAEAKAIAAQAAFKGVNPFTAVSAWIQSQSSKTEFVLPEPEFAPLEWTDWSNMEKATIANFFLKSVESCDNADSLRFWDVESVSLGFKNQTPNFYVLADSLDIDEELEKEIINTRSKKPMLMKPIDWMDGVFGGYASNQELKADPFIRGIKSKFAEPARVGTSVYAAVNNLQSVGFTINAFVLNAVNELLPQLTKETAKIGKFVAPIKGVHFSKSGRAKAALMCAEEYKNQVFYHPWNVDYRGRMYPISTVLNVQSTDFEKSLLRVATPTSLCNNAERWMLIHIANCAGKDKLSLDARVSWAQDNMDFIKQVAAEPVSFLKDVASGIQSADKPFQLVAICKEYVDCFIAKVKDTTDILVAVDATCSGIQILAGITKDESAAELVNVKPLKTGEDKKGDAYQAVADFAKLILKGEVKSSKKVKLNDEVSMKVSEFGEYAELLDRSVCKKVVMTLAYNSSPQSHSEYLRKSIKEKGVQLPDDLKNAIISAFGVAIRDAMKELLPNVIQFKDWINKCAAERAEQTGNGLTWQTPAGFEVVQFKNEWKQVKLNSSLAGKKGQIVLNIEEEPTVLPNKHGTCTMPNLVHSLDASVLHVAFDDFHNPFALIHDSVMVTASDVDYAIGSYKSSYVYHFGNDNFFNVLMDMFYDYQPKNVKPFDTGDLVVKDVLVSKYFLS